MDIEISLDRASFAPSGIPSLLIAAPKSVDSFIEDEPCDFEVHCELSRSLMSTSDLAETFFTNKGNSFFCSPSDTTSVKICSNGIELDFLTNSNREFGEIQASLTAISNRDATSQFMTALYPVIDQWSFLTNTPVSINKIVARNIKRDLRTLNYTLPYRNVIVHLGGSQPPKELMPIFALYREAKNSASNFYRFFCYYKILEGIFKKLRKDVFAEAREKGIKITTVKEIVPDLPELHSDVSPHSAFIGKAIFDLFNNELQREFRNELAHFSLDDGSEIFNPSDFSFLTKFDDIIYLMEICCQIVIKNQENYYQQVRTD